MTKPLQELADHIAAAQPQALIGSGIGHGELMVTVNRTAIVEVMRFLRDDPRCRFELFCDLCGVDYP